MSRVWDMILQWGSTIKVSIELPVTTRHCRDMTEKLLKAMLNLNTHTHTHTVWYLVGPFFYFKCANSEGSGETVRMRRLTWAFAGCLCDKYHNLMSWLISFSLKKNKKKNIVAVFKEQQTASYFYFPPHDLLRHQYVIPWKCQALFQEKIPNKQHNILSADITNSCLKVNQDQGQTHRILTPVAEILSSPRAFCTALNLACNLAILLLLNV